MIINNFLTQVVLIFILIIPAIIPLTKPGLFPTQDYIHVARIYQMDQSLKDGQFPVRWVPDLRYGEPLFNFYAPLPYYLGSIIHTLNFSFLDTTKILFILGFVLSALTMFLFSKEIYGLSGAILSATLYTYAPYHSVDVYVRGALSESWALVFFPLIFFSSLKLSQQPNIKRLLLLSFSLAGLFLTHNIMTILFFPFFLGWLLLLIWQNKNLKIIKYFLFSIFLGIGLAASFLLPAFFEKNFVQSDKMISGYFDYRGHFVELRQFFIPFWGYGASLWKGDDDMSFQLGIAHILLLVLSLGISFIYRRKTKFLLFFVFFGAALTFSLFMQHNKSTFIWTNISILAYTQFPWRFLGISIFFISVLGGIIGMFLQKKWILIVPLIILIFLVNINYFQPQSYNYEVTDELYVSPNILSRNDKSPKDYLPIWTQKITDEKISTPRALKGDIMVSNFQKRSASAQFYVNVLSQSEIEVPIAYYPGWQVFANGQLIPQEEATELGLIRFKVDEGDYLINLRFLDTPIRSMGNIISLVSLAIVLIMGGLYFFVYGK